MARNSLLLGFILIASAANLAGARVLPGVDARVPAPAPRPEGLPSDTELEVAGARIGEIHFNPRPVFDIGHQDENTSLFRLANRLHVATRMATIEDQLLFRRGDAYRGDVLAESARILRDTRYLRDALIRPVAWHDGVVDVEVTTQDVWTFNPGVSFGRRGGRNSGGFQLEDLNFLGMGTQLGIGYESDVDRDSRTIRYRDRHLGSSWWDLTTGFSDNSDGRMAEFSLDHPFYALDTRWAAGFAFRDDQRIDSRYDLGHIVDRYDTHQRGASIYWGRSKGLVAGWARRLSFGLTYDDRSFGPATLGVTPGLLPADRSLVYPWVAMEWVQNDFRTVRNRDQIEKTEDYSLGWQARAQVGYAASAFGSNSDAVTFDGKVGKGVAISPRQTLQFDLDTTGRLERGAFADTVLGAQARYYFRQSPRRLLFLSVAGELGAHLDDDHQLLLGGDNGLRGYPLRYQSGEGRWLLTAEQRFFTDWYPFQLFNVGAAVFYDMGATWGRDPLGSASQGVLRDVGFGLRLGNSRSALGNVLHLDVAYPLDGDSSARSLQFLVETKKSF